MISLIWAQTPSGIIGKGNRLPWSIKEEMKHFRETTLNHTVLMGSKTFQSMNSIPLKNRINYVLTRDVERFKDIKADNLFFISNLDELITKYQGNTNDILYVIGGSQVYDLIFDKSDEILRTIIKKEYIGDVYISNFNYNNYSKVKQTDFDEFYIETFKRNK